jgi:hypothetical protein
MSLTTSAQPTQNDLELLQQHHDRIGRILERQRMVGHLSYDEMAYFSFEISQLSQYFENKEYHLVTKLIDNGPQVFHENGQLNIVFLRNGKPKRIHYGFCPIDVCRTKDDRLRQTLNLDLNLDEDEYSYYIKPITLYADEPVFGITKSEWLTLNKIIPAEWRV